MSSYCLLACALCVSWKVGFCDTASPYAARVDIEGLYFLFQPLGRTLLPSFEVHGGPEILAFLHSDDR